MLQSLPHDSFITDPSNYIVDCGSTVMTCIFSYSYLLGIELEYGKLAIDNGGLTRNSLSVV